MQGGRRWSRECRESPIPSAPSADGQWHAWHAWQAPPPWTLMGCRVDAELLPMCPVPGPAAPGSAHMDPWYKDRGGLPTWLALLALVSPCSALPFKLIQALSPVICHEFICPNGPTQKQNQLPGTKRRVTSEQFEQRPKSRKKTNNENDTNPPDYEHMTRARWREGRSRISSRGSD